jgi:hypothetical protein
MKLFLVFALTVVSSVALADHHQRHMVTLTGYETGDRQDRSLDFTNSTGGNGADKDSLSNIALNYAYAINNTWQVGASYKQFKNEFTTDDNSGSEEVTNESKAYGFQVIYNKDNQLVDTCFAALHFDMKKVEDSASGSDDGSKSSTWGLELGHRYGLGKIGGMNFTYSPSVTFAVEKTDFNESGADDASTSSITLNFVKFDVIF